MDMQMNFYRKLPIPKDLKEQFPADERIVKIRTREIRKYSGSLRESLTAFC